MVPRDTFSLDGIRIRRQAHASEVPELGRLGLCPFAVIVDSREQLPYEFSGMVGTAGETLVVRTITQGLASGDYTAEGLEGRVAIERKSLGDLYGSVTWGRDRFEREIVRLEGSCRFAVVVIEATWEEIADPAACRPGWENRTDPRSVEGTIAAWSIRYPRVHWWTCGSRRNAELRTFGILKAAWAAERKETG